MWPVLRENRIFACQRSVADSLCRYRNACVVEPSGWQFLALKVLKGGIKHEKSPVQVELLHVLCGQSRNRRTPSVSGEYNRFWRRHSKFRSKSYQLDRIGGPLGTTFSTPAKRLAVPRPSKYPLRLRIISIRAAVHTATVHTTGLEGKPDRLTWFKELAGVTKQIPQ